jgi:hypothetical protein
VKAGETGEPPNICPCPVEVAVGNTVGDPEGLNGDGELEGPALD